mgnify:CR=1 FL=1
MTAAVGAKKFTLVIDAGHGGDDSGAVGAVSKEKNLTLKYALAFGKMVEQNCPDVNVIYTRTTDRFLELWQRAEIANKAKADLFISVHINALPNGKIARGYQTYALGRSRRDGNRMGYIENLEVAKRENAVILYEKDYQQHYEGFDPDSPESNILFELMQDRNMENSVKLAKLMQKYVCAATGRQDQGVHQDNLAVLRLTSMPACLLELGFISTPDEERYMNSNDALYAYARGMFNAFMAYRNKQPGINVPYKPETAARQNTPESRLSPATNDTLSAVTTVFKVQILVSDRQLKEGSSQLKDVANTSFYKEKGMYKYTVGESADYAAINQLRRELSAKFPGAFVVAFRGSEKVDVNEAIRQWRQTKK